MANSYTQSQLKALKEASPESYLRIKFTWTTEFVLPYEDGISLLKTFYKAEVLNDDFNDKANSKIIPLDSEAGPAIKILSKEDYIHFKMNYLKTT